MAEAQQWWQRPTRHSPWCCFTGNSGNYTLSLCGSWKTKRIKRESTDEPPHDDMCFACARTAGVKYRPARPRLVTLEHFPRSVLVGTDGPESEQTEQVTVSVEFTPDVDYAELGVE